MKNIDFKAIEEVYAKAEKNFNPTKSKVENKEPSRSIFTSKVYYKFLSMNNKTLTKLFKTNPEYFKIISDTNGDYSRRKGGNISENALAHYNWVKEQIRKNSVLKNSILQVFVDTYDILKDLKWKAAFKLSFDYCKKNSDYNNLVSGIKSLYFALVISFESMLLKVIEVEYNVSYGKDMQTIVLELQDKYYAYMKKSVIPTINLTTLMRNTKDPNQCIKTLIVGEDKKKKSSESGIPVYKTPETRSQEGAWFDTMKHASGSIAAIAVGGLVVAGGIVAGVFGGAGMALTAGVLIASGSLWLLIVTIPSVRLIIYYNAIANINLLKELKLQEEMLNNNIAILTEKYNSMKDGPEKDKLKEVIDKQKAFYEDIQAEIRSKSGGNAAEDEASDAELSKDEEDADKEADKNGDSTNTDGDDDSNNDSGSSNDGGFDVLI